MHLSAAASPDTTATRSPGSGAEVRLRRRWLVVARLACLAVAILTVVIWGWGVPLRYTQLGTVCTASPCGDQQLTPFMATQFQATGLSLHFFAASIGTVEVLFMLVYLALAAAIFWRMSDTRIGLLTATLLVTFGATQTSASALAAAVPIWSLPVNLLQPLSYICLILFLYVFPDGRFVPGWTRFVALAWIPFFLISTAVLSPDAFVMLLFGFIVVSLFAQVYRYRRVSTSIQQQQTKWVVFGVLTGTLGSIALIVVGSFFPLLQLVGAWGVLVGNTLIYLFGALVPLSIGIAILRSRLWDIDVLINKALVYGTLTALLAAVYSGLIIGLERLAGVVTGQASQKPVVIVVSTLAIAALFQPLRRRIQHAIDRRFYRRRYDAARTLTAFSATLRNELDFDQLRDHLLAVVHETMQPTHSFLWLRQPERHSEEQAQRLVPPRPAPYDTTVS